MRAMDNERIRRRVIVSGHVQGVFFRDATRECAQRHGVAGWARNRDDGTVEVLLEGERGAVQAVIAFCADGPSRADVHDVTVIDESVSDEPLSGFQIR